MLAFLLLLQGADLQPAPSTPFDKVIPLEIDASDPILEGHGHAERVEYTTEFSGTLHIWPKAEGDIDLFLRLEGKDGNLVAEDDDSGGGVTPYVTLTVVPGRTLVITVAFSDGEPPRDSNDAHAQVELLTVAAPETDATRTASDAASVALHDVRRLRKANDLDGARKRVQEAIEALLAAPSAQESESICAESWLLGYEAQALSLLRPTEEAWALVYHHRLRTLPDEHPDLQRVRGNLAMTLKALGNLRGARTLQERVLAIRSRTLPEDDPGLQRARGNLALTLKGLGDLTGACALEKQVLDVRSRTLPEDHADLQLTRLNLAWTLMELGDLNGAKTLGDRALEVYSRTLPEDHPNLQEARLNVASTLHSLGNLQGALALRQRVVDVYSKTLPAEHPDLLAARGFLAATMADMGDLRGAREIQERVLEVYSRTLPEDDPNLQWARRHLAATIADMGELREAREIQERVLEIYSRTLPKEHPDLQRAALALAATIGELGNLQGARTLEEQVLDVRSRTLPEEHPDLQSVRRQLAKTLRVLGDLQGARTLQERAITELSKTLPEDHISLQKARGDLAVTLKALGDLRGARALEERVLEVLSSVLPEDHTDLQTARQNLAATLYIQGDLQGARELEERVLAVRLKTLPEDHPDLQSTRLNLAETRTAMGDAQGGRALLQSVADVRSRTLPEDHPALQNVRMGLGLAACTMGNYQAARDLLERVLTSYSRTLPEGHPELQKARLALALALASDLLHATRTQEKKEQRAGESQDKASRCAGLIHTMCQAQVLFARSAILESPARQAEERCVALEGQLDASLSFALGFGTLQPMQEIASDAFSLVETIRGAAVNAAWVARRMAGAPEYQGIREKLQEASGRLAALAQKGMTGEDFDHAMAVREDAERRLMQLARDRSDGKNIETIDVASVAAALQPREAVVGFRRFAQWTDGHVGNTPQDSPASSSAAVEDHLCAFIVRSSKSVDGKGSSPASSLTLLDLGPIALVEAAVSAWREGLGLVQGRGAPLGARSPSTSLVARGNAIRRLVFDPLRESLGDANHLVVALDDVLHLVPLDALPMDLESRELLGTRLRIEARSTLSELLDLPEPLQGEAYFLGLGDVRYGEQDEPAIAMRSSAPVHTSVSVMPGILRGGVWSGGFDPLPGTRGEVTGIESLFAAAAGAGREHRVLAQADASREKLLEAAPRARFLHIATHGWFAPESISSWSDPGPLDNKSGLGLRMSSEELVRGMSPMLLCGLALAGANMPEDSVGRAPGLITAEELSTLDLTNCELAVLSACDTNVGERRAGQGVHSLQMALQMAGARSVITSLWKVPDEATKELMLDFYRRLWLEKKPKWQALWEAKMMIRDAKDATGNPKYSVRDWAAWVLTGEPD